MKLDPPYTVREIGGRVLVVPCGGGMQQAIAEVSPYGGIFDAVSIGRDIATALNHHQKLIGGLLEVCRECAANPRNLTRRQQITLINAVQLLKAARNDRTANQR